MDFEIKRKDGAGRIGRIELNGYRVETPTIMPVINPGILTIPPEEMEDFGAEILITNSYIIYRNKQLHKKAVEEGLHSLLEFKGPIMTDSGAYQLSVYGDIEVSSREILDFQEKIGSDIHVPIDLPTPPEVDRDRAEDELEITLQRAGEAVEIAGDRQSALAGPIQGSTYLDLRRRSAKEMSNLGFDLYCIGGVVPMMESYDFENLVKAIVASKSGLPYDAPVHLFGAGHPMVFALSVALGCDLFDSAAYALFAKRNRYLTNRGTWNVKEMEYLPCSCPICHQNEVEDLVDSELLARHNLHATFRELRVVKEAIRRGELMELAGERARSHPRLLSAFKWALDKSDWIEDVTPISKKSAFFFTGEESLYRPEVKRAYKAIEDYKLEGDILFFIPHDRDIEDEFSVEVQLMEVKPPFVYPTELGRTYPYGQSLVPKQVDSGRHEVAIETIERIIDLHGDKFREICMSRELDGDYLKIDGIDKTMD
ncbi:tRNA guanosine(15) transglycosylase TgtA [Methanonatronarchaeum sp. AMET6-2]|uniref:tRNA guanosine(15) transglycosylase TgtA n=1 Tax=Methanonatronarchaeum sp. AMET6-2 TaxID=2933293 RepID=UPI00120C3627|nr:tRNA guanosine(15) transglycosylase TgtA [Methanonatronarchaeum sp. AMET6-2]RZN60289.1 MAG: tRNA guanosine(15) transglycosylase TgtA [Methanonatronarchaeia archaeon]UOY10533.1 tRNA guanosine(15) transglycosylase TgtA [Methanonatronarchaeum sp. AMET6-2]